MDSYFCTQFLSPREFIHGVHASRAKQAAEEGGSSSSAIEEHPSAAKAGADFRASMARLKSCPFKTFARLQSETRFFAGCLALLGLLLAGGGLAAVQAQGMSESQSKAKKAAPPDVLVFANGDQLTGKFLRSVGGNAVFHSDMAGDITVTWDKVKEIHSASKFVVLQKGFQPGRGALPAHLPSGSLSVENKQIELTRSEGGQIETIPLSNVAFVIDQPTFDKALRQRPGFFSAWTGNASAGATIVEATQNTYTFNGGIALVRVAPSVGWVDPRNRTLIGFQGSYGKITEPDTPTEKTAIYHAYGERDEYFSARVYALGQTAFDHNFSQSLDLQQVYGGGLGWTVVKQASQTLDLKATIQYERQSFLNATPGSNQSLIGSTFAANYVRKLPKGMVFNQQLAYLPAWNNMHAYSGAESDTLILPIYKRLGLSVGTVDTYLNDPPVTTPPTKPNSFQFTFGASYSLPAPR
jgi:hypothetical protein